MITDAMAYGFSLGLAAKKAGLFPCSMKQAEEYFAGNPQKLRILSREEIEEKSKQWAAEMREKIDHMENSNLFPPEVVKNL